MGGVKVDLVSCEILVIVIGITTMMMVSDDNNFELKATLRIFAEADAVTQMLTEEINLQVDFASIKKVSKKFTLTTKTIHSSQCQKLQEKFHLSTP